MLMAAQLLASGHPALLRWGQDEVFQAQGKYASRMVAGHFTTVEGQGILALNEVDLDGFGYLPHAIGPWNGYGYRGRTMVYRQV